MAPTTRHRRATTASCSSWSCTRSWPRARRAAPCRTGRGRGSAACSTSCATPSNPTARCRSSGTATTDVFICGSRPAVTRRPAARRRVLLETRSTRRGAHFEERSGFRATGGDVRNLPVGGTRRVERVRTGALRDAVRECVRARRLRGNGIGGQGSPNHNDALASALRAGRLCSRPGHSSTRRARVRDRSPTLYQNRASRREEISADPHGRSSNSGQTEPFGASLGTIREPDRRGPTRRLRALPDPVIPASLSVSRRRRLSRGRDGLEGTRTRSSFPSRSTRGPPRSRARTASCCSPPACGPASRCWPCASRRTSGSISWKRTDSSPGRTDSAARVAGSCGGRASPSRFAPDSSSSPPGRARRPVTLRARTEALAAREGARGGRV